MTISMSRKSFCAQKLLRDISAFYQDQKYMPFARKLLELARAFEDHQIVDLVQHYLEEKK